METRQSEIAPTELSLDSIAEDVFGLNIRGVKSILTIWRQPRTYFAAARNRDWNDSFTPAIRLWLSFFALFSALKFWWLGKNAGMIGAFATGFKDAGLILPDGVSYEAVGAEAVLWIFGLIPVVQIVSMLLLAVVYNFWGERAPLALRQRYLFAVMIPSSSLMPVFLTVMLLVPQHMISAYGIFLALSAFLVDFQTGYRGAFSSASKVGRAWRAGLLAFVLVTINTSTAILTQIVGIVITSQKYGVGAG